MVFYTLSGVPEEKTVIKLDVAHIARGLLPICWPGVDATDHIRMVESGQPGLDGKPVIRVGAVSLCQPPCVLHVAKPDIVCAQSKPYAMIVGDA